MRSTFFGSSWTWPLEFREGGVELGDDICGGTPGEPFHLVAFQGQVERRPIVCQGSESFSFFGCNTYTHIPRVCSFWASSFEAK